MACGHRRGVHARGHRFPPRYRAGYGQPVPGGGHRAGRLHLNSVLALLPDSQVWHQRSVREHEAILDAVARRDPGAARDLMYGHVRGTARSVRALLESLDARAAQAASAPGRVRPPGRGDRIFGDAPSCRRLDWVTRPCLRLWTSIKSIGGAGWRTPLTGWSDHGSQTYRSGWQRADRLHRPLVRRPGERVQLMASSSTSPVTVRLVRLRHGDPNPAGPGLRYEPSAIPGRR